MQLALHLSENPCAYIQNGYSAHPHLARVGDGAHDIAAASEGNVRHLIGKTWHFDHNQGIVGRCTPTKVPLDGKSLYIYKPLYIVRYLWVIPKNP